MTVPDCTDLRELAPELALGTLTGRERALALGHLARCAECQRLVEELSDAADAVLLVAPEVTPPDGFAGRVAAGLEPRRPRRRFVAAVAGIAALAVGLAFGAHTDLLQHRSQPSFALHAPGVRTASFAEAVGEQVHGQVFFDVDRDPWVFMTLRDDGSNDGNDSYVCQLDFADGHSVRIGSFQLHDGVGSWGRAVDLDLSGLKGVRLLDAAGHTAATAPVSTPV
jgi:hypothetical protein